MDPFVICCSTCRTQLKVSNPQIVGKIVHCPSCRSMVLVEAPRSAAMDLANTIDDASLQPPTRSGFESTLDQIDDLLKDSLHGTVSLQSSDQARWRGTPEVQAVDQPAHPSDVSINPLDPHWVASHPRQRTRRRVLTATAVTAFALLGIAIGWLSQFRTSEPARDIPIAGQMEGDIPAKDSREDGLPAQDPATAESDASSATKVASALPDHDLGVDSPARDLSPESATVANPTDNRTRPGETAGLDPDSDRPPPDSASDTRPLDDIEDNTLRLASHAGRLATLAEAEAMADAGERPAPDRPSSALANDGATEALRAENPNAPVVAIDHFADLFDNRDASSTGRSQHGAHTVLKASQPRRDVSQIVLNLPDEFRTLAQTLPPERTNSGLPRKPVDVAARLDDSLSRVQIDGGVSDVLQLIAQASTIPLTLRPDGLRYSRINPSAATSVHCTDTTIRDVLNLCLTQHRLGFRADGGHVLIDRENVLTKKQLIHKHYIDDLARSGINPDELTSLVHQLVQPLSWRSIDDPPELTVAGDSLMLRHNELAHFQTLHLLERLRIACGMQLQGSMDRSEFGNDWQRRAELNQPVALRAQRNDDLNSMFRNLNELAGKTTHILVDWHAIAESGWAPSDNAPLQIPRQPLSAALTDLLEPFGWTWRCVGSDLIEITTASAAASRPELGFHSVGNLTLAGYEPAEIRRLIELTIGEQHFRRSGGKGVVVYNDAAQSMLVYLPQSQQLAVDWILKQLR